VGCHNGLTCTITVAGNSQKPLGVKVRVCWPTPAIAGSKLLPDTPAPDQTPEKLISSKVVKSRGALSSQSTGGVNNEGVIAAITFTLTLALILQVLSGSKLRLCTPGPAMAGLKLLPLTPGPLQVPLKAASW
jgi:hypothetical protein